MGDCFSLSQRSASERASERARESRKEVEGDEDDHGREAVALANKQASVNIDFMHREIEIGVACSLFA